MIVGRSCHTSVIFMLPVTLTPTHSTKCRQAAASKGKKKEKCKQKKKTDAAVAAGNLNKNIQTTAASTAGQQNKFN